MAWGQQYGFDQLMKIVNRPRDEAIAAEREAARTDTRQLSLPLHMTLGEAAYNASRQNRINHPEHYDAEGRPTFSSGIKASTPTTK